LNAIAELIDAGKIKPHIQQIFNFDQIHDALSISQGMHVSGKLAVAVAN
jgi:NADPH:quinone reductase-like Zn-dependent oxidoreductase